MVGELNVLNEWIPEQMQPGTIFVLENAGRDRRKGRSLLGRARLPVLRHAGPDHAQTTRRPAARDLRLRVLLGAIFYPRRGSGRAQTVLTCGAGASPAKCRKHVDTNQSVLRNQLCKHRQINIPTADYTDNFS